MKAFHSIFGIILFLFPSLLFAQIGTISGKGKMASVKNYSRAECSQEHGSLSIAVTSTVRTNEKFISSTMTPDGILLTVEAFNRSALSFHKTGAANVMIQVLVDDKAQYSKNIGAGSIRELVTLSNVRGKKVKIKVINLSPSASARADINFSLKGMTETLFLGGNSTLHNSRTSVSTLNVCTNSAVVILKSNQNNSSNSSAEFAKVVVRRNNANGIVLAEKTIGENLSKEEIFVPNGCADSELFIQIVYLNQKNKPSFNYKVEAFAAIKKGDSMPGAVHHGE